MKKYCTKCGREFIAVGREVICPACKQAAAEDAKRAAVLKAKKASWAGESVPVRISGRASTVIRRYGAANNLPFAAALDDLLKASVFFQSAGQAWEDITPYKSHRRDKSTATSTTETAQDTASKPQDVQDAQEVKTAAGKPQDKQEAPQASKQAAKTTSKTSTAKKVTSKTNKGSKA